MYKVKIILFLIVIVCLTSCSGKSTMVADEHEHEESLQLTSYSDSFEVFAEATPFVKGVTSDILAHFTFLSDFKPLEESSVKASLIIDSEEVSQTMDAPARKGIYSFSLTPVKAGSGKVIFDINSSKGSSRVIVDNIKVFADVHDAEHYAAEAVATSSNGAVFTKEQSWKVDFATEESRKGPFGQVIKTTAQLLPSQAEEQLIIAKTGGIVIFSSGDILEGKEVKRSETLFRIESSSMADANMSVRYNEVSAEYARAKTEYERKLKLASEKIVSESELLKAKTELENIESVHKNLSQNFSKTGQSVSAPIGGFIKQVLVRNGEYVQQGAGLAVVSQNNNLLIRADLNPKYYSMLESIVSATIKEQNSGKVYTLEELKGKLVSFGRSAGSENPLIPVVFRINNSVNLLPGSFVQLIIKTKSQDEVVTIANEAIIEEMGNYFVYRQLTPEFFEKSEIKIGQTDGYRTEVISGLKEGDRVISKGAMLVKMAQASGALDAHSGHVH
ncbi:MAG: efflux RND transporter periplasmic adaptor subunit [Bacteroidales bacterium]